MFYIQDLGRIEQTIVKQAILAGEPIPDRIANAPVPQEGLQFYLTAFIELDTDRSNNLGLTPIPWSSIIRYAEFYNLSHEETEDLLYIVRRIDNKHLERLETKA